MIAQELPGRARGRGVAWRSALLLLVLGLTGAGAGAPSSVGAEPGGPRLAVGELVQISADRSDRPHVEPILVADPRDPRHLVAASMAFTRTDASFMCAAFTSFDGGATWSRSTLPDLEKAAFSGDPWLAFGPDGTVYLSCVRDAGGPLDVVVFRSKDGGKTWSSPAAVPLGSGSSFDHPVLAVDATGGAHDGIVYVAGIQAQRSEEIPTLVSLSLARSVDGGRSFEPPVTLVPSSLNLNIGGLAILSDGSPVLPFFDFQGPRGWLESPRMWVVRGTPGGRELSWPFFVAEQGGGFFPSLVTDGTELYLVWTRTMNAPGPVVLATSSDGGKVWREPVIVDGAGEGLRLMPAAALDPAGNLLVAWLDSRHAGGSSCWDLYVAASTDRGRSFLPAVRVTPEPACPDVEANLVEGEDGDLFSVTRRWRFGGDYLGVTAAGPGRFHVAWVESRGGPFQVWTVPVTLKDAEIGEKRSS